MKKSILIGALLLSTHLMSQEQFQDEVVIYRNGVRGEMLLGGSGAHGGHHLELNIQNLGWSIVDSLDSSVHPLPFEIEQFIEKLRNLKVEVVDSIELNGNVRTAINIPDQSKIILNQDSYEFLSLESTELVDKAHFFLHEFLPLIGIDDSGYEVSRQIIQNNLDSTKLGFGSRVLYQQYFNHRNGGTTFQEARKICEAFKKRYFSTYFSVYCLFQEKVTSRYLSFDPFSHRHQSLYRHPRYRRPIPIYNPYHFQTVYGLRVVGFGLLSQLQDIRLIDSDTTDMPTYKTHSMARFRCMEMIAQYDDYDFNFYRARCETVEVEGGYKFNIVTKNPLLQ